MTELPAQVTISRRFNGPPDSGNGGYVCGVLARGFPEAAEVTLRVPPPLDRELAVRALPHDALGLYDGERLVADAQGAPLDLTVPEPPSLEAAGEASRAYVGFEHHAFPGCFVCGPLRAQGDGLRVFPGRLREHEAMVAAPWVPDADLADEHGVVRSEFVWSALDCPGAFAVGAGEDRVVVLGRMHARLDRPVVAGEPHVVIAWPLGASGRKHLAGTAVFTANGELCGKALQTWIELSGRS